MIILYTFKTFPWIEELKKDFPDVFIFGKLKEDFERFCEEIEEKNPDWIIGIAKGRKSSWESGAVNKFNKGGVIKGGVERYELYIPDKPLFKIQENPQTTFCNWTAFKIKNFLEKDYYKTKFSFLHIAKEDINSFLDAFPILSLPLSIPPGGWPR